MIHVRVIQGHELIADLPEWNGPIPRVGDYFFHPPMKDQGVEHLSGIAGSAKTVTWRMWERSADPDAKGFVPTTHPYVEIHI